MALAGVAASTGAATAKENPEDTLTLAVVPASWDDVSGTRFVALVNGEPIVRVTGPDGVAIISDIPIGAHVEISDIENERLDSCQTLVMDLMPSLDSGRGPLTFEMVADTTLYLGVVDVCGTVSVEKWWEGLDWDAEHLSDIQIKGICEGWGPSGWDQKEINRTIGDFSAWNDQLRIPRGWQCQFEEVSTSSFEVRGYQYLGPHWSTSDIVGLHPTSSIGFEQTDRYEFTVPEGDNELTVYLFNKYERSGIWTGDEPPNSVGIEKIVRDAEPGDSSFTFEWSASDGHGNPVDGYVMTEPGKWLLSDEPQSSGRVTLSRDDVYASIPFSGYITDDEGRQLFFPNGTRVTITEVDIPQILGHTFEDVAYFEKVTQIPSETVEVSGDTWMYVVNDYEPNPAKFLADNLVTGPGADRVPDGTEFTLQWTVTSGPSKDRSGVLTLTKGGNPVEGPELKHGDVVEFALDDPAQISGVNWDEWRAPNVLTLDSTSNPVTVQAVGVASVPAPKEATVTVRHETRDGTPLSEPLTLSGHVGETYSTTPLDNPAFDGATYHVAKTPGNASGTFEENNADVVYLYDVDLGTVVVKHITEDGRLLEETVFEGPSGTSYETAPIEYRDYEATGTPNNATGMYPAHGEKVTVAYVYRPIVQENPDSKENQDSKEKQEREKDSKDSRDKDEPTTGDGKKGDQGESTNGDDTQDKPKPRSGDDVRRGTADNEPYDSAVTGTNLAFWAGIAAALIALGSTTIACMARRRRNL